MSIITFLYSHWVLSALFMLSFVLYLLVEMRARFTGPKRLSPQEAVTLMNQRDPLIFDLRDKSKFDQGHIIHARQCGPSDLPQVLEKLNIPLDRPILLVCQLGQTTARCGTSLQKLGYTQVCQLSGGMQAWTGAELPIQRT